MRHALIVMVLALALPRVASADLKLAAISKYDDHLSPGSRVAGQVLVGLWLGAPSGKVSLASVRLRLPSRRSDFQACVSVNTRDGEYGGQGTYKVPQGEPDQGVLLIDSKYKTALQSYEEPDFGVRAELKPDCGLATPGLFVPAVAGGSPASLVALINSQRAVRVTAALHAGQDDGPLVATGVCTRTTNGGRSTAFDTSCQIPLPAVRAGEYMLTVKCLTRAGDEISYNFHIGLDPASR